MRCMAEEVGAQAAWAPALLQRGVVLEGLADGRGGWEPGVADLACLLLLHHPATNSNTLQGGRGV